MSEMDRITKDLLNAYVKDINCTLSNADCNELTKYITFANRLERRLINITNAIEDFLNDARERPAVEKLERAMNDYGMRE